MKRSLLAAFAALSLACAPASAFGPEGYPGSLWLTGFRDLNGFEGWGTQGSLTQGVQWLTLPGDITVETYGRYFWRLRNKNQTYFDAYGPSVGVEFSKAFIDVGAEFGWTRFGELGENSEDFNIYLSWYKKVNLARDWADPNVFGIPVLGFPLSTWGKLTHDLNNLEGDGAQGFVRQGIEWFELPLGVVVRTLVSYNFRFRSENRPYYNTHGPAVGVELGSGPVDLGIEYMWRDYPELKRYTHDFYLYLSAYFNWDLRPVGSRVSGN